ncbi:hypothetical protein A1O3_08253 [Capronia epimyces CBS 606.96]|uniref:Peptidase M20 domain-containing protein 2 n=1 Tax=Capronia epimyces CBS 606.96 TaxID=1182542 RepID=W9XHI4_9EURO|nr:uncharacterized protein A1O3_08253 [Capronia epimyces CBS 606.96]EXJ79967.1 hypothetical protein A1O3_08253 [Capronia epimyces CBS 606.96]
MAPQKGDLEFSLDFVNEVKQDVDEAIGKLSERLRDVFSHIHNNPELAMKEHIAHDTICDYMESQGFQVTRHAYGVETSFEVVSSGSGKGGRLISINAEYDALPHVGHACGHSLIAVAGVAAFFGLHYTLQKRGLPGRVQLLGTPAEENLGGKAVLLKGGAYNGVDAVLMTHPWPASMLPDGHPDHTAVGGTRFLSDRRMRVEFFGKATHAAVTPWEGVNAYDAAVAAHTNIGLLRQQILPYERIHGCLQEAPQYANVIGEYAQVYYVARSRTKKSADLLASRVRACFEAAALSTGCQIKITEVQEYNDFVESKVFCNRFAQIANGLGTKALAWDDRDGKGSSDIGNVSYHAPALHTNFVIDTPDSVSVHTHDFTAAVGTDDAFDKSQQAGGLLALLGLELLTNDALFKRVRGDWEESLKKHLSGLI